MRDLQRSPRVGFTLVELLVVIAIIGLIVSLILVASADGVRRAEERATQSLITKLEAAINDRLDALLNTQPPINQTHRYLAAINYNSSGSNYLPVGAGASSSDDRRANVIAQFDYLRAELPDVFFLNSRTSEATTAAATAYPLNFAAAPYPPGTNAATNFVLPLGNTYPGLPLDVNNENGLLSPSGNSNYTPPPITGMFGASFNAAAGLYKQLGYAPRGYDGVDNNNNGLVDDFPESGLTALPASLANHTHKTARSEVLYAILVEGLGPLGSVFNRDDFTSREVQDTDGDGLLEFVDAWGEPLQFYRWPIYYGTVTGSSDSQKGSAPYSGFAETRQQDPLDTNQLLMSPGWWSRASNPALTRTTNSATQATFTPPVTGGSTNACGQGAIGFMNFFHILVDPTPSNLGAPPLPSQATGWDRGGGSNRRAYYSRFLIVSGGPDKEVGVAQLNKDYADLTTDGATNILDFPQTGRTMEGNARLLIYVENQASQADPVPRITTAGGSFCEFTSATSTTSIYLQQSAALDDISNHNVSAPTTGVR